ncbi:MAG TPA: transcriptional repressor LexA [Planctomycetota bacterium]|nr:transcriptional repressor LexA [Planctomycetota bacterium]
MRPLTPKQQKILSWMLAFQAKHGMPPTVREIGSHFRMVPSSVFGHLKLIEKKGYLKRGKLGARSLQLAGAQAAPALALESIASIPEVGRVAAGVPLLAQENIESQVVVDRAMLRGSPNARHFILKITGDSMIEAGILDGDRVVVRQQDTAENGQIAVALLDDEATVKHFYREDGRVRLQPANAMMKPIYAKEVAIQGVVVCVLRTYN